VRPPQTSETKEDELSIVTEKHVTFSRGKKKLFRLFKKNSTSNCDFLKFIISVRGDHCDYSSRAPKITYATEYE
jgi:hypothetical protein